jgi:mannose-6-phosphate isomerase-like protein (cupin superfamily)
MTTTPEIPAFNPQPSHTTHETTLYPTATSRLDIYNCTPPDAGPSSWVTVTYTPPTTTTSDRESDPAKHTLLAVPAHWHEHHDEAMTVLSGKLKFFIDGHEHVLSEGQELLIRRGTVHGFEVIRGVQASFRERALAAGWEKDGRELDGSGTFKAESVSPPCSF